MTTTPTPTPNYFTCPDKQAHAWIYKREPETAFYLCLRCQMQATKEEMRKNTNKVARG